VSSNSAHSRSRSQQRFRRPRRDLHRHGLLIRSDRDFRPEVSSERIAPCSTFKIWNTLIGLESGLIVDAEEAFFEWDGEARAIPEWNRNLTLQEAFRASCVPAFQALARKIESVRMQSWLDKIGYGDRDISAGIDVFWLPAKGRKTVLIPPREQAQLMCSLVSGKTAFSAMSVAVLKPMMVAKETGRGVLYGKTGSATGDAGIFTLGWFVGFVESKGKTHAFACLVKGDNFMGKDARAIAEKIFEAQGAL